MKPATGYLKEENRSHKQKLVTTLFTMDLMNATSEAKGQLNIGQYCCSVSLELPQQNVLNSHNKEGAEMPMPTGSRSWLTTEDLLHHHGQLSNPCPASRAKLISRNTKRWKQFIKQIIYWIISDQVNQQLLVNYQ